jgi:DNA-binding transcriptional regulator YiaG
MDPIKRSKVNEDFLTEKEKAFREKRKIYFKEYYLKNKEKLTKESKNIREIRKKEKTTNYANRTRYIIKVGKVRVRFYSVLYLIRRINISRKTLLNWEEHGVIPQATFRLQTGQRDRLYTIEIGRAHV